MQIDPGTVAATATPSGLQMNSLNSAIIGGATNVDEMQIDPGTIVVPTKTAEVGEVQIDSRTVAPHITIPTAPGGLQVKSLNCHFFRWCNCGRPVD